MISESVYWKEDLARWASHLARRRRARFWTERAHARVEKAAMLGFFAIRRLIESGGRLSDATISLPIRVHAYSRQSDYMTPSNNQRWMFTSISISPSAKRSRFRSSPTNSYIATCSCVWSGALAA